MFEKLKEIFDQGKDALKKSFSSAGGFDDKEEEEYSVEELIKGAKEYVDSIITVPPEKRDDDNDNKAK